MPPSAITVDSAIAEVNSHLGAARLKAAQDLAKGKKWIAAVSPIWELLERRSALQTQKTFPTHAVYYDAKVVGLEAADGRFKSLRVGADLDIPTRTWDNLVVQWDDTQPNVATYAKPVELKSAGAKWSGTATTKPSAGPILSAVGGGLSDEQIVAHFLPKSQLGKQSRKDLQLRRMSGQLVVIATNPVTNEVRTIKLDTKIIDSVSYRTYESELDTVRGTTAKSRGLDGVSNRGIGAGLVPDSRATTGRGVRSQPDERLSRAARARGRPSSLALERFRARVRSSSIRRRIRIANASTGRTWRGALGGVGRATARAGVGVGKGLLLDLVIGFVIGLVTNEVDRRESERDADRAFRKIEDGLVALYLRREPWMSATHKQDPSSQFFYIVTMQYDRVSGQDGAEDRLYGPYVSGETFVDYGGRGKSVTVSDFRIATAPALQSTLRDVQVISIAVNYTDLDQVRLNGTYWRAYGESTPGRVDEVDLSIEFTLLQFMGRTLVKGRRVLSGEEIRITDSSYNAERHTLVFTYHFPYLGSDLELASDVTLLLTEPHLFEGEEIGRWTGAVTKPLTLKRVYRSTSERTRSVPMGNMRK